MSTAPDVFAKLNSYEAPSADVWRGRKDSLPGERFFQHIELLDLSHDNVKEPLQGTAILGFCSDEGIRRNEGRPGAKSGPTALREQLAKLPCHGKQRFYDAGSIICEGDLESAQAEFASLVAWCQQQGLKTTAFGGGHEIAWAHFSGLTQVHPKLAIVNFDAHFDLRPLATEQQGTSGTPFWQIHQYCQQQNKSFDYCCLGIQPHANTASLFSCAADYKTRWLTAEQINHTSYQHQTAFLDAFLADKEAIYLSICMDVFAESVAPGVSAPQSLGLLPWQTLPLLKYLVQTGKVVALDIAELSPPLDLNNKTARLAAMLAAELLDFN